MTKATTILNNFHRLFPEMSKPDFVRPSKPIYCKVQSYAIIAVMTYCNLTLEESMRVLSRWEGYKEKYKPHQVRNRVEIELRDRNKDPYLKQIVVDLGHMIADCTPEEQKHITEQLTTPI